MIKWNSIREDKPEDLQSVLVWFPAPWNCCEEIIYLVDHPGWLLRKEGEEDRIIPFHVCDHWTEITAP